MHIIFKPRFKRDAGRISRKELLVALEEKILQIKRARTISQVTGLKLLRGYSRHYRIIVKSKNYSYRIGAIIRGDKIWMVRFLPRKIVYKRFP